MATVTVNSLIEKASRIIQDQSNIRWPQAEWLSDLNDAQREVVMYKPQASVKNVSVPLAAGQTKQVLPSDAIQLIDVVRNMGSNGTTPGSAIRITAREVLDAQVPEWHSAANMAATIKHYCFDPRDPKTYYVYPKAASTTWHVDVVYSAAPTDCALGGTIQIDDIYANALLNLMLYRAYSKDAEYAQNAQLAAAYYQAALASLGVKGQNEASQNPNNTIGNPNVLKG
jgi:hypothetical protein